MLGKTLTLSDNRTIRWNALIFYLCTGDIYFKPLRSQELPTEKSPWPQATEPPACSPKSMYRLADMVSLFPAFGKISVLTI